MQLWGSVDLLSHFLLQYFTGWVILTAPKKNCSLNSFFPFVATIEGHIGTLYGLTVKYFGTIYHAQVKKGNIHIWATSKYVRDNLLSWTWHLWKQTTAIKQAQAFVNLVVRFPCSRCDNLPVYMCVCVCDFSPPPRKLSRCRLKRWRVIAVSHSCSSSAQLSYWRVSSAARTYPPSSVRLFWI